MNGERVTIRIPTSGESACAPLSSHFDVQHYTPVELICTFSHGSDSASDTEVPYADIMITVRGVSTPELNQVVYLSPADQNQVKDRFLKPVQV